MIRDLTDHQKVVLIVILVIVVELELAIVVIDIEVGIEVAADMTGPETSLDIVIVAMMTRGGMILIGRVENEVNLRDEIIDAVAGHDKAY